MPIVKNYKLHDPQWRVFNDKNRFVVLVAGRRFGKTIFALIKIISIALSKKCKVWYVAPTYKQAENIAWKMIQEMLPYEAVLKKNEVKLLLECINGSEISLKGAENEDSLRGVGLDFVVLDEYGMMKPDVWEKIIRPMLSDTQGNALFIGTPFGKNNLYNLYIKGQNNEDGFSSYLFKTSDNPFIDKNEIEKARQELPERIFKQEYEASFEEMVGLYYPMFNPKIHCLNLEAVPDDATIYQVLDPHDKKPWAIIWGAVDKTGTIYIVDEYPNFDFNEALYNDKTYTDYSVIIQKKEEFINEFFKRGVEKRIIDPNFGNKTVQLAERQGGQAFTTPKRELARLGFQFIDGIDALEAGHLKVGELLRYEKKDDNIVVQPKIFIINHCKNTITHLSRYSSHDPIKTDGDVMDKARPLEKYKDFSDCVRYLAMSNPRYVELVPNYDPNYARYKFQAV